MQWKPCELHTHTNHSGGQHTLMEMAKEAAKLGLSSLALTDHNTMSGLIDQEIVEAETGIHIVRGLEWTTFYGHMLTLGITTYEDWRVRSPLDIEEGIKAIHKQGGVVGIAHPYCIGSPICTGCFWEYEISEWDLIDYIEVWSEPFPSIRKLNKRAFDLWTKKLDEGFKISATSGRDWHNTNSHESPLAVTYLQVDEKEADLTSQIIEALKAGRISVTQGPLLLLTGKTLGDETEFKIGNQVEIDSDQSKVELMVQVDHSTRQGKWELEPQPLQLKIMSNQGILKDVTLKEAETEVLVVIDVQDVIWLRAELSGVLNEVRTMITFTNPIYLTVTGENFS